MFRYACSVTSPQDSGFSLPLCKHSQNVSQNFSAACECSRCFMLSDTFLIDLPDFKVNGCRFDPGCNGQMRTRISSRRDLTQSLCVLRSATQFYFLPVTNIETGFGPGA
jgi:hypothetical protein